MILFNDFGLKKKINEVAVWIESGSTGKYHNVFRSDTVKLES